MTPEELEKLLKEKGLYNRSKISRSYWQKRFELLEDAMNNKGVRYIQDSEAIYRKAIKETEKEISKWYMRYANNEGISYQDAMRALNAKELEEFHWDVKEYIKKGKTLGISDMWKDELERASINVHVTRLEALKLQMKQQVEELTVKKSKGIDNLMRDIYSDSFYKTAYEFQKGFGVGSNFAKLDKKVIDNVLSKPWATDGSNFSQRIWGSHRAQLVNKLHEGLTLNLIQGKPPDKLIKDISDTFHVDRKRVATLVYTEKAYFQSIAQWDSFKNLGVEEYEIVATLDSKTSEICQAMDGKHFKLDDFQIGSTAPPFHPRCRTATAPYFDDEFEDEVERAARDEEGNYYTVPANMKYDDWHKAFVEGDESVLEKLKSRTVPNEEFKVISNPLDFSSLSDDEFKQWKDNYYNKINGNISFNNDELKVLDDYGEGSYSIINGVERFEEGSEKWNRLLKNYGNDISRVEEAKKQSELLSEVLDKFELDEDILVHRAIRDPSYLTEDITIEGLKKLKGKIITEKGFTSTSLSYQSKFEGGSKNVVHMEMVLPKGTKGAYIDKYVAKNEYEFLLDKNTQYKVLDVGERTVKVSKYDLKSKQWVEVDKTERFMKVQVIPKETPKTKVKLDVSDLPPAFNAKSEIKNTQKMIDFINELENPNQEVLELYKKMGKMENIESNGIPFKISHGKDHALTPSYYTSSMNLADIKLNIPKLNGDDLSGQINTMLHEEMHLMDFYNRKEVMKYSEYFSTQQKGLVEAVVNSSDEIGDDVQKLFENFKIKYVENSSKIQNKYKERLNELKQQYIDRFGNAYKMPTADLKEMKKSIKKLKTEMDYELDYTSRNLLGGGVNGLQDIYDALSGGMHQATRKVLYGHGRRYYSDISSRVHEIVANYGALSITRPDLIDMLRKDKPELVEALEKYIREMIKKVGD